MAPPDAPADVEADFVIVGAGSAGCLLADRLSADGRFRVVLVEAGRRWRDPLLSIPLGVGAVWKAARYNWSYRSQPEAALGGRRLFLPRGRLVGGSSMINAMNHVRGNAADFDAWAALGLPGWAAAEVLPLFRRLEDYAGPDPDALRGHGGPLAITEASHADPVVEAAFSAFAAAGHTALADYNGARQEGFGRAQFNLSGGRRLGADRAFLAPALRRANLRLLTGMRAEQLEIAPDGRATGVVCRRGGRRHVVTAGREVILAAGAFGSPALLLRSGLGPAADLARLGIPLRAHLPAVGANLWDHPRVAVEFRRRRPSQLSGAMRLDRLAVALARAALTGRGPASEPLAAAHLFARSRPGLPAPNLQFLLRLFNPALGPRLPFVPPAVSDAFGLVACLVHPASRGRVRLVSADPADPPAIETGILGARQDVEDLTEGFRMAQAFGSHPAFAAHHDGPLSPSSQLVDQGEIEAFLRASADTIFHPAGTCAMGPDGAGGHGQGAVDGTLRVRGVRGLRVVDASVMPLPVRGNIQAAVFMVAEKAAGLILDAGRVQG